VEKERLGLARCGRLNVVAALDGVWEVERTGGALPPLVGVRKRIRGERGTTVVGPLPGAPFEVRGLELHYRAPFSGFVDVLEPDGRDRYRGRATLRGTVFGHFAMRRRAMADELEAQLVKHIDEAYALEHNVLRMLDGLISTTGDPELERAFRQHKQETQQHADTMEKRLRAHDASPSIVKEAGGILGALMKSVVDLARPEKIGRNARDAYATEHLEIASYELLARIAERAGDEETAAAAREILREERKMAETIERNWDLFAELSLEEAGLSAGAS
jgi:ferritin-like metal-binding protein YciE